MSILDVRNLNISADQPLVRDVSFSIEQGEIMALVGESGSGKTLTALSIMGLLPPKLAVSGTIDFNMGAGNNSLLKLRGNRIGMIFQEPMTSLNPLHTVGKQVGEVIHIHQPQMDKRAVKARVLEVLGMVQLAHFSERLGSYPHQLSGGERQRVMIAMAVANHPALLIADEPTTALDVTVQAQILELLKELQRKLTMSVLLITHDLAIVRKVADKVAIMSQGEIVETGKTSDIFRAPQHVYTQHLLQSEARSAPIPAALDNPPILGCKSLSVSITSRGGMLSWHKTEKHILANIDLSLPEASTLGIVGESGSGKTTLALALLRLMQSKGEITFAGESIDTLKGSALRAKRRNMQIVFQDPYGSLNPRMSVGSIIREGLDVHEKSTSAAQKDAEVDAILKEVGLTPEMKTRYPHEFSGGQRQRISIARALVLRPRLVILDEPTSALDASVQAQVLELLKQLQAKYRLSYIFISHDLRTIRAMSHKVMVLQKGKVVESGTAEQVLNAPKEAYTKALMAAALLH